MAMFLSRLKQVLNLGTKSITANGTYTASSDVYDGYSSVSVTVPTPPSITPSNSSPAALTSGSAVTPSANGYAIESYSSVTPSSTQVAVSANDIVKIGGNGVIVDSVPTPTSLTPSNSSPATITSGNTYTATANGKAVESVTDITPTTIDGPVSMSANTVYRPTVSSYAINSYTTVSSSDTNPPNLTTGNMYRIPTAAGAGGYLYKSSGLKKVKTGTFTTSTSSYVTVTCGFEPKYVAIEGDGSTSSGKHFMTIYNSDTSTSQSYFANASTYPSTVNNGTSTNNAISITSTGFTYRMTISPVRTCRYFAIG